MEGKFYLATYYYYPVCSIIEINPGRRDERGCSLVQLLTPASADFRNLLENLSFPLKGGGGEIKELSLLLLGQFFSP